MTIARTRQVTVANIICGVDVSSQTLDARIGMDGPFERFARTPEGLERLGAFCRKHDVELVVMEATGGYEKQPFAWLWAQGIPAAIVNPRSVRQFAQAMGLLEKTDKIDAGIIAWFAQVKRIKPREPASETQERLSALVTRLRQLTDLHTAQGNQRRLVSDPTVHKAFDEMLALIIRQTRSLEGEIAGLIDDDPLWRKLDESCRSIKGVADRTVARLMAHLPELGTLPNKAIAKLAGLAPIADDSGKHSGKRSIKGGRSSIRSILFVVADLVRRYDSDFAAFHKRLCEAGKPKKVIRTALAHKLLTRLNAKARDARKEFACAT
jgi:transposase